MWFVGGVKGGTCGWSKGWDLWVELVEGVVGGVRGGVCGWSKGWDLLVE